MSLNIQENPALEKAKATFKQHVALSDFQLPIEDFIKDIQRVGLGKLGLSQGAKSETTILLETALFGELLSAASRAELLLKAEQGDIDAKSALGKLFGNKIIYPGTFDPFTLGHADVARRAVRLFGEVVIAIGVNPGKSPLFSLEERVRLIKSDLSDLGERVSVEVFDGSLVSFARKTGCSVVLRGIRSVTDYEQELALALLNQTLSKGDLETLFIPAREGASFVSSSTVKSVVKVDEDASTMVSKKVLEALLEKRKEGKL